MLVDGTSLMYRAFFAMPNLTDARGRVTNAAYGFTSMLLRLLQDYDPDYLVVAFDRGKPEYRLEIYPEYKGHRPDMPDDLRPQFNMVKDVLDAMGIAHIEQEGVEADDLLGVMARAYADSSHKVTIVTGDKDMLQLVDGRIRVEVTKRGITDTVVYDPKKVKEEFGLPPHLLADMKGLMGDSSDNIPGVPGVGKVRARRLLNEFGTIEGVLQNVDQIGGKKLPQSLREHADVARMSKELAVIRDDLNIGLKLPECSIEEPDPAAVGRVFSELGFESILERMGISAASDSFSPGAQTEVDMSLSRDPDEKQLVRLIGKVTQAAGSSPVVIDWLLEPEQNPQTAEYVTLAVYSPNGGQAVVISRLSATLIGQILHLLADDNDRKLMGHNLKGLLVAAGLQAFDSRLFDCRVAAYLLQPSRSDYDLHSLGQKYLSRSVPNREHLLDSSPAGSDLEDLFAARLTAIDQLAEELAAELQSVGLTRLFEDMEMPLVPLLGGMQVRGVKVEAGVLEDLGRELQRDIAELEGEIWELAGREFNINSPQQLSEVLFEDLGLPVIKETKTGYSTDSEVLNELSQQHELPRRVLDYRQLVKLRGTYVSGLLDEISPDTGRVHTTFHQCVTATGRLSSSDPNLQNIPIREERGRQLRRAFTAPEGWVLLAADYSQIELRILAHLAGDEKLQEAFREGRDIHVQTASEVFNVPPGEVTEEMRERAKAVNFGIIYGISGYGLSRNLGIDQQQSQEYIDRYLDRMPGVSRYLEQVVEEAKEAGHVRTLFGRIRYLPDLHHRVWHRRQFAERAALNTTIQGTAADIIKKAMVKVQKVAASRDIRCHLLLQVHDELIWEVVEEDLSRLADSAREVMEDVVSLDVPLRVDLKAGTDWYNMSRL